ARLYELFLDTLFVKKVVAWKWARFLNAMGARMVFRHPDAVRSPEVCGEVELSEWLTERGMEPPYNPDELIGRRVPVCEVERMRRELLNPQRRLLVRVKEDSLTFPHRSLAEYLAGR